MAAGQAQYAQRDDWAKYWDQTAGRIKRLKVIGIATGAQRINAVRAGDINVGQVTGVDVPQAKQLIDSKELSGSLFTQVTTLQALTMKAGRPEMQNLKLRQAIQLAIDKQAFSHGLYSGYCAPSSQDYPAQHWAHVAALDKKPQYNEAKAKKLLTESGVDQPVAHARVLADLPAASGGREGHAGEDRDQRRADPGADASRWSVVRQRRLRSLLDPADQHRPGDTLANTYLNSTPPVTPLIPVADQPQFLPLQEKLTDPTATQAERAKVWAQIATKLYDNAYVVPVCNASQVWLQDGSIANMKDMLNEWSGLVDFRYLYKPKS